MKRRRIKPKEAFSVEAGYDKAVGESPIAQGYSEKLLSVLYTLLADCVSDVIRCNRGDSELNAKRLGLLDA